MMSGHSKDARLWWGLVAFVVGAVVLLQRFDVVPANTWDYLWPSILVVSGLRWMLSGDSSACSCGNCSSDMCGDCGKMPCACDAMPMAKPAMHGKKPVRRSKRK